MVLSHTLIQHSPGDRFIALWHRSGNTIRLFDIYTGHLCVSILGRAIHMAFIRDGTKLAYCAPDLGLRIRDIAALMDEDWYPVHAMNLDCKAWQMDG